MARRRTHDDADHGHEPGEPGESLEVVRRTAPALEGVLCALPGALEEHDERHPLLTRELDEALALRGRPQPDRPAHHREVLRAHDHRAPVDGAVPGDERVGRRDG